MSPIEARFTVISEYAVGRDKALGVEGGHVAAARADELAVAAEASMGATDSAASVSGSACGKRFLHPGGPGVGCQAPHLDRLWIGAVQQNSAAELTGSPR